MCSFCLVIQSHRKAFSFLDIVVVLADIHACLKQLRTSNTGIIEERKLCETLSTLLDKKDMNAELAVKYLLVTQFLHENLNRPTGDQAYS